MRVRRLMAMGAVLAVTSVAFVLGASPASAQGYCPQSMEGWQIAQPDVESTPYPFFPTAADGQQDTAAEVVVYGRPSVDGSELMVQFRNLRANGKSGVVGQVGRADNTSDLGMTGSIGDAPFGAWCSDIVRADYIWSSLTYQVGGVTYGADVYGYITFENVP